MDGGDAIQTHINEVRNNEGQEEEKYLLHKKRKKQNQVHEYCHLEHLKHFTETVAIDQSEFNLISHVLSLQCDYYFKFNDFMLRGQVRCIMHF